MQEEKSQGTEADLGHDMEHDFSNRTFSAMRRNHSVATVRQGNCNASTRRNSIRNHLNHLPAMLDPFQPPEFSLSRMQAQTSTSMTPVS